MVKRGLLWTICLLLCGTLLFPAVSGGASEKFESLVDVYWNWRLQDAPEFATNIDVAGYDDKVELFTLKVLDDRNAKVSGFLSDLKAIDRSALASSKQVSYDILEDTLQTYLDGYQWKDYGPMNPVNFLEGIWTDPASAAPHVTTTYLHFYNYILHIHGLGEQALDFIVRMRRAMDMNTTNHWVSMAGVLPELDEMLGASPIDSPIYAPFNETLDNTTLPENNKTSLKSDALAVVTSFVEKMKILRTFIVEEYQNATRPEYGVSSLPGGADYYRACLKWHLSIDITPEQVHQTGLDEVDRINKEMVKVMGGLQYLGSVKHFFEMLNNDDKFLIKTPEETIARFESIINDRIKPKLSKFFKDIPDNPVIVKPMPYDGPGGTYSSGSADGSRPGIFYANVIRPEDNPTYSMVALTLHETNPGHHLQDIYSMAATGVPDYQKVIDYSKYFSVPHHFPFYTSYTEGWGLYSESLGEKDQLDIYEDEYELMGRYSFEIFRACRLVVDTGLHYFNWSRERAIEYMLTYTSLSRASVEVEIDRYITWPGQATAYKIGEMKIKSLRQMASNQLGRLFDIRDFHAVILGNGAVPLSVLEHLVNDWVASVKATDSLEKISSDFWDWRMSISPIYSSSVGLYKHNDKLDSYAYGKFDAMKAEADNFLLRTSWIDESTLSHERTIAYRVLKNILETFIAGHKWKDYESLNPINFLELWFSGLDFFVSGTPFDTEGDLVNYVRKIELIPNQFDEMIALCRRAINNGHISHNVSVSRVPGNIDNIVTQDPTDSGLYKPFTEHAQAIYSSRNTSEIDARIRQAIEAANDKYLVVKEFLIKEYMPRTRTGLGVGTLPDGQENYKACLLFHTSINITPEQVHQQGLDEVHRIAQLMRQKMTNLGFSTDVTITEMYQNLTSDKRFLLPTPEESLAKFKEIVFERIQPQIHKYFNHAPDLPLVIKGSASDGVGGEYWAGTADGSRPGVFYANLHRPEYNPTYKMVSLSLHEALPGHHLADSYGLVADIPVFMKNFEWLSYGVPYFFPFYNSFAEGWALYCEYLGEEMGIYHNDYEMLGRYSDEMLRAVRLVVDTGIHYYNWTRQDAIDYMLNYTAETPESAAIEIDRYTTWPGQACGYKIGEFKIKQLRKHATDALGDKFDLAEFHYTVLRNGALPLDVLEQVIDEWIVDVKAAGDNHGNGENTTPQPCNKITNSATINSYMTLHFVSIFVAFYVLKL